MARQPRREWELEFTTEWMTRTYSDAEWQTNVQLGPIQPRNELGQFTQGELTMLGVWRRRIDALVYLPDRLVMIEAVMRSNPGKLAILELYRRLIPQTPELAKFWDFDVDLVLLYVIRDPIVNEIARERNIIPIQYVPVWFLDWFKSLLPRQRQTSQSAF